MKTMATKKKGSTGKKKATGKKSTGKKAPAAVENVEEVKEEVQEPAPEPAPPVALEGNDAPDTGKEIIQEVESGSESPEQESEDAHEPDSPAPTAVQVGFVRDPRLPPVGSTITRKFKGKMLEVKVLEDGFEYEGTVYPSISRLAKQICGGLTSVNGFAFFKLGVSAGGAGAVRHVAKLSNNITRIEKLTAKMRAALAQGALALADAEAEVDEMKKKAAELQQSE
jgi:hypothetical protein